MNKKYLFLMIGLGVFFVVGASIFYFIGSQQQQKAVSIPAPEPPREIKAVSGVISEVTEKNLKIISVYDPYVPFDASNQKNYKVFNISNKTAIYRNSEQKKSEAQFSEEQKQFNSLIDSLKSQGKNVAGLEPPNWYEQEKKDPSYLKPGMEVSVFVVEADKNSNDAAATKIVVDRSGLDKADEIISQMKPVLEFSGKVGKIASGGVTVVLERSGPAATSSEEKQKTFKIDDKVKVFILKQKTDAQFLQEQAEFNKKLSASGAGTIGLTAPSRFEETVSSISELKVGQSIRVKVIDDNQELIASEIYLTETQD